MPRGSSEAGVDRAAALDWHALGERCRREAHTILRNPADAEEAAQEALIRAWRNRNILATRPASWLSVVVRNEALRLAERTQRFAEPSGDVNDLGPSDSWEARVLNALYVETLLSSLAPADELLLRLRYVDDLTQPQIAQRLGLAEGTVKVRLHRLRRRLRERTEATA